jgi:hypothetical protein
VNDGYESVSKQRSADLFDGTMAVGGQPFHNPVREGVPMVEASVHDAQAHPECNGNGGQVMCVTYSHSTGAFRNELRLVSMQLKAINTQGQ